MSTIDETDSEKSEIGANEFYIYSVFPFSRIENWANFMCEQSKQSYDAGAHMHAQRTFHWNYRGQQCGSNDYL